MENLRFYNMIKVLELQYNYSYESMLIILAISTIDTETALVQSVPGEIKYQLTNH